MVDDWRETIEDRIEFEYAYIVHDKDLIHDPEAVICDSQGIPMVGVREDGSSFEIRKEHMHLLLNWTNTTTQKAVIEWINAKLSKTGKKCCSVCQRVGSPLKMWKYLIHDTKEAKEQGKYQYSSAERVSGNGFDIERYQQTSLKEKRDKVEELSKWIIKEKITNYLAFYVRVLESDDELAHEVVFGYSGHFEKLCKGAYLMVRQEKEKRLLRWRGEMLNQAARCTDATERMRIREMVDAGMDPETGEIVQLNPFDLEELIAEERRQYKLWREEVEDKD